MISNFLKILLSFTTVSGCFYSMQVFGLNYVLLGTILAAFAILASIVYIRLRLLAKNLGIAIGIISFLILALLLLAANMGGSFSLSPSNEVIAIFLVFTSLFGFSSFFWAVPSDEDT